MKTEAPQWGWLLLTHWKYSRTSSIISDSRKFIIIIITYILAVHFM